MTSASWKASEPIAEVATEGKEVRRKSQRGREERERRKVETRVELTLSTEDDHGDTIGESVLHGSDDVGSSRSVRR